MHEDLNDTRDVVEKQWAELSAAAPPDDPGEGGAAPAAVTETAPADGPARGPDGKFAPKEKPAVAAPTAKAPQAKPAPATEPAGKPVGAPADAAPAAQADAPAAGPVLRPPADWSASAKAKWDSLPREVQEEAHRLHVAAKKGMQEGATHRASAETWQKVTQPYEHLFRAAGRTADQGVVEVLQTYAALHTAPMPARAGIVANLIRNFIGTDEAALRLLAGELDKPGGGPAPAAQPQGLTEADLERKLAEREQKSARDANMRVWQDFEASQPEFLSNVMPDLTGLLAAWRQRNPTAALTKDVCQKLYEKALATNDETAPIIAQRKEAEAANARNASTQPSSAAAVSLKNEPAGPGAGAAPAETLQDEVRRQWDRLKKQRR